MSMFTGFTRRRDLASVVFTTVLGTAALAAFAAAPARGADLEHRYGERYDYPVPVYPPQPRYGEVYEYHAPAPQAHYEAPREYRVIIYPVQPRYGAHHGYPRAHPPRVHGGRHEYEYGYREEPVRRYAPPPRYDAVRVERDYADVPLDPYGRVVETEPLLPPGLVGPPRW